MLRGARGHRPRAVCTARRGARGWQGRALLLALPLALLLFVFFPRLAGAFWAMPRGEEAQTGLSDSMSPGSIRSSRPRTIRPFVRVLRARAAAAEERYWRGPVLHDFDGHTWRRGARCA